MSASRRIPGSNTPWVEVGDHRRRQPVAVGLRLLLQVDEVDVAVLVGGDDDHLHAGHRRRGGVGAVGGLGDQADDPLGLSPAAVVGADGEQASELALGSGVRLQGDGVVAGDFRQPTA